MAIFRLQVTPISRLGGHSSVAAAAYRAGEKIRDDRTNELHNHSRRKDVTHSEILLPGDLSGANMEWARTRASLWNSVEAAETRKNAHVATEIQVTLPHELPPERRLVIARTFSQEVADHYRVAVDLAVHDPRPSGDPRNYHAHLLLTTREVSPAGLGAKAGLDMSARERVRLGLPNLSQEFTAVRERWATLTNEALKEANIEARVDHRSLAEQGIDREPRPYIPFAAYKIERAGKYSEVATSIRADYEARVQARLDRAAEHGDRDTPMPRGAPMVRDAPTASDAPMVRDTPTARDTPAAREPLPGDAPPPHREPASARQPTPSESLPRESAGRQPAPRFQSRDLDEVRREARENWLRMRAARNEQAASTSNEGRPADHGAQPQITPAADDDYQP